MVGVFELLWVAFVQLLRQFPMRVDLEWKSFAEGENLVTSCQL